MGGDSFDVTAILRANVSDFNRGLTEAKMAISSLKDQTGSSMERISSAMAGVGKGMTMGITAPIVAGVAVAVKQFAGLEQALGGVETLFKGSARQVIANSETAYKRAGLSGTKYMEQVTSFSAKLLQGLGGDTAKAASYADKAVVDMSDNANKFGTNISEIQRAYQGFARGNFTMLDNLKLGFGGTQEEMARLVNQSGVMGDSFKATAENVKDIPFDKLIEAIHVTQQEMGITGTTAKEASQTVSGSFGTMVAAGQNLVDNFGRKGADINKLSQQLIQSIGTFANNVKRVLGNMWDNLPMSPFQKWTLAIITALGPVMLVLGKVIPIILAVSKGLKTLVLSFKAVAAGGTALSGTMGAIGGALAGITAPVWIAIGAVLALIGVFVYLWKTNDDFRNGVITAWNAIKQFISNAIAVISAVVMAIWGALVAWWDANHQQIIDTAMTVWNFVSTTVMSVITAVVTFVQTIWGSLVAFWNENHTLIITTATNAWNTISNIVSIAMAVLGLFIRVGFGLILPFITMIWENIKLVISTAWEIIKQVVMLGIAFVQTIIKAALQLINGDWSGAWDTIKQYLATAWDFIKSIVGIAINFVKSLINNGLNAIKGVWSSIWSNIGSLLQNTWNTITNTIRSAVSNAISTVTNGFNNILNAVRNAMNNVVNSIRNAWNNAINAARSFIGQAVSIGVNIVQGFVSGVMSAAGSLISSVVNTVRSAINAAKGALGIHSPSRVFMGIGRYTNEGFVIGIERTAQDVSNAMTDVAKGAISAFTGQDVVGSIGLNDVNSKLNALTSADPSLSFNGGSLSVNQQPANIMLSMGNQVYKAFVNDITDAQGAELALGAY